jgi:hypothetical protein
MSTEVSNASKILVNSESAGHADRDIEKRLEIVPGRLGVVGEVQCGAGHQYFKAKDSLSLKSLPRVGMFRSHFWL